MAENIGWPAPRWSGRTGPYFMVKNSVAEMQNTNIKIGEQKMVRSDLETRLEQWASSQSPPIEIAWEGLDYTKTILRRISTAHIKPCSTKISRVIWNTL